VAFSAIAVTGREQKTATTKMYYDSEQELPPAMKNFSMVSAWAMWKCSESNNYVMVVSLLVRPALYFVFCQAKSTSWFN
jgi:hypothetical protein